MDRGPWTVNRGPWTVNREFGIVTREDQLMAVQTFRDLEVWQVAMDLATECYCITKKFPRDELFGMTSQIRRAAASVPANIAEGQGRDHTRKFLNFLSIARGSLMEVQTHLLLAERVGLLSEAELQPSMILCERTSQMISRLRQALERKR